MNGKPDSSLLSRLLNASDKVRSLWSPIPRLIKAYLMHLLPDSVKCCKFESLTLSGIYRWPSFISNVFKLANPDAYCINVRSISVETTWRLSKPYVLAVLIPFNLDSENLQLFMLKVYVLFIRYSRIFGLS